MGRCEIRIVRGIRVGVQETVISFIIELIPHCFQTQLC